MATPKAARIDDVGAKIGGARKDRFAKGMGLDDLSGLDPAEAHLYVTKDNAWPTPDYEALVTAGMPVEVAACIKLVRDRLAAKPDLGRDPSQAEGKRRDYVRMMLATKAHLEAATTLASFSGGGRAILASIGYEPGDRMLPLEGRNVLFSVFKDRKSPFEISSDDFAKVRRMLKDGFPAKVDPALKGVDIVKVGDAFYAARKGLLLSRQGFETEDDVKSWLRERHKNVRKADDAGPKTPTRPHLDRVERTGLPDVRAGRSVTAQDFMETFGFRGVEFGNWLPGDERQKVLDLGYDALMDLADVLGIPPSGISLEGRLGLAFGARGKGTAAAHYEPTYKAVNLTRLSGAGTVAHEWYHALDHYAGEVDVPVLSGAVRSGSGWYEWTNSRVASLANLSGVESAAWDDALRKFRLKDLTIEEAIENTERAIKELEESTTKLAAEIERHDDGSARAKVNLAPHRDNLASRLARLTSLRSLLRKHVENPDVSKLGKTQTSYMREAIKLCGKSGDYWKRPTEMGARAFEAAVFDRLAEKGGSSPYLVQGVEADLFEGPDFKGNPYPSGAERKPICDAVIAAVESMAVRLGREADALLRP